MAGSKPGRGSGRCPLRNPDGMRERIARAAEKNGRSMNAEIVNVLESAFPAPRSTYDQIAELVSLAKLLKEGRTEEFSSRFSEELFEVLLAVSQSPDDIDPGVRDMIMDAFAPKVIPPNLKDKKR